MRAISFAVFTMFCGIYLSGQNIPDVSGIWCSSKKDCKVQLYKVGNSYEGKIIWLLKDRDDKGNLLIDKKNPNPELRNKPLVGMKVLWDAIYNPVTRFFEDGVAYVKGNEYCGKFRLNSDGTLSVTGYICRLQFLHKTDVWTRVNDR